LESAGFVLGDYKGNLNPDQVLVIGPGAQTQMTSNIVAIGLDQQSAAKREHISTFFEPGAMRAALRGIGPADVHDRDPHELSLITSGADIDIIGDGVLAAVDSANIAFCQIVPWQFDPTKQANLKRTFRRASFTVTRLLSNFGVASTTPILTRFRTPVETNEKRWLEGLYLDQPEEWDDPYRFFRW